MKYGVTKITIGAVIEGTIRADIEGTGALKGLIEIFDETGKFDLNDERYSPFLDVVESIANEIFTGIEIGELPIEEKVDPMDALIKKELGMTPEEFDAVDVNAVVDEAVDIARRLKED